MSTTTAVTTTDADVNAQIDAMTSAFNKAIATNSEITAIKTEKGSEETAAQQRPNIG